MEETSFRLAPAPDTKERKLLFFSLLALGKWSKPPGRVLRAARKIRRKSAASLVWSYPCPPLSLSLFDILVREHDWLIALTMRKKRTNRFCAIGCNMAARTALSLWVLIHLRGTAHQNPTVWDVYKRQRPKYQNSIPLKFANVTIWTCSTRGSMI